MIERLTPERLGLGIVAFAGSSIALFALFAMLSPAFLIATDAAAAKVRPAPSATPLPTPIALDSSDYLLLAESTRALGEAEAHYAAALRWHTSVTQGVVARYKLPERENFDFSPATGTLVWKPAAPSGTAR